MSTGIDISRATVSNRVVLATLDRPPVNALDTATIKALTVLFRDFARDRLTSAVVLTGSGSRAFCAGIDLRESPSSRGGAGSDVEDPRDQLDAGRPIRELFWAILECPVPVIGAINGPAVGAGLAIAAVCDVLIATERATFSVTEIDVGRLGAFRHLSRMVGPYVAKKMYFTGMPASAADLLRLGAVDEVVSSEALVPTAMRLADLIAEKSPIAVRLAKEMMNRVEFLGLRDAYQLEQDYTTRLRTYEDGYEAGLAASEKRSPEWRWR